MSSIKNVFLSNCMLLVMVVFDDVRECSGSKTAIRRSLIQGITSFPTSAQDLHGHSYEYVSSTNTVFDVKSFGAKGDGVTDDTKAFEAAWQAACNKQSSVLHVPSESRFRIGALSFSGPCQSNIVFKVDGTLLAPMNPRSWDSSNLLQWILITKIRDLTVTGNGLIDAQGEQWWHLSEESYGSSLPGLQPTALRFFGSYNVTVQGITITNSPRCHLKFDSCISVSVANVTISSPENRPNTDGIHLQNSQHVEIQHSYIGCGDDCVSIQTGCSGIRVHNINCGPGHGISIGALGVDGTKACVSNVTVYDSTVHDSLNGVRIKTWQGGMGSVRGVSFSNIQVSNVKIPINIDQYYCESRACMNRTSAVAISDVTYEKIRGSYMDTALHLACSDSVPCTDLKLIDIELQPSVYVSTRPFCWNSYGQSQAPLQPDTTVACLRAGKPLNNPGHAHSNTDVC